MQLARIVVVRVILVDVICVMLVVLIAHVDVVLLYTYSFRSHVSVVEMYSLQYEEKLQRRVTDIAGVKEALSTLSESVLLRWTQTLQRVTKPRAQTLLRQMLLSRTMTPRMRTSVRTLHLLEVRCHPRI